MMMEILSSPLDGWSSHVRAKPDTERLYAGTDDDSEPEWEVRHMVLEGMEPERFDDWRHILAGMKISSSAGKRTNQYYPLCWDWIKNKCSKSNENCSINIFFRSFILKLRTVNRVDIDSLVTMMVESCLEADEKYELNTNIMVGNHIEFCREVEQS